MDHVSSISGFINDIGKNDRLVCVSNDRSRKKISGVTCVFWREFLEELFFS